MSYFNENKKLTSLINKLWEQKHTSKIEDISTDYSCDMTTDICKNEEKFFK